MLLPPLPASPPTLAPLPPVATLPPVGPAPLVADAPALPLPPWPPLPGLPPLGPPALAGPLGELPLPQATLVRQARAESATVARPQVKAWTNSELFMRSPSWDGVALAPRAPSARPNVAEAPSQPSEFSHAPTDDQR